MLRRLRLLFAVDCGDVGNMDGHKVLAARLVTELRKRLDERHALDITDSASKLDDADIGLLTGSVNRNQGDALDPVLDGICDMWDATKVSDDKLSE